MARLSLGGRSPKALLVSTVFVGLAGLTAASLMQVLQLRPQLGEKQRLIQTLTAQNQQLQQELAGLQTDRQDLEARLNDARKELVSTTTELGRLRAAVAEVQGRYDGLASEKVQVEARVAALTRERDTAQEQAHRLEEDKLDLERVSARLRDRFALLDRDYQRLLQRLEVVERERVMAATLPNAAVARPGSQATPTPPASQMSAASTAQAAAVAAPPASTHSQTVELPPIVVRKDQAGVASAVQGRVVELNEAHQFVVVDKGSQDGILLGMTLDIVRGTARVGRVRVVRVRPQMSACDIIRSDTVGPLQVGDAVAQHSW